MVGGQHGRPGVALTELRQVFERLVARGVSNSEACRVVGINRRTGTRWRYGRGIPASGGRTLHYPPVVTPKRTVASSSRCAAPRAGLHCPARLPRRRSLSGSPQPCGSAPLPSPPERARPFPSSPARPWRNGSRTRGDERRAASARGGHRPRGGVWPVAAATPARGEGSGVQGDGQQSWPRPAPRLRVAGWLRPCAVAAPGGELGAFTARTKAMTRRVGSPRSQNASAATKTSSETKTASGPTTIHGTQAIPADNITTPPAPPRFFLIVPPRP